MTSDADSSVCNLPNGSVNLPLSFSSRSLCISRQLSRARRQDGCGIHLCTRLSWSPKIQLDLNPSMDGIHTLNSLYRVFSTHTLLTKTFHRCDYLRFICLTVKIPLIKYWRWTGKYMSLSYRPIIERIVSLIETSHCSIVHILCHKKERRKSGAKKLMHGSLLAPPYKTNGALVT